MERYDAEAAYDEKIFPLMAQILDVCKQHQIPMLATFQLNNNGDDPNGDAENLWCTSMLAEFKHGDNDKLVRAGHTLRQGPRFAAFMATMRGR